MVTTFQVWNNQSNNLIDEFESEADALAEVQWRIERRGEDAAKSLSLVGLDTAGQVEAVIEGENLLRLVRERHPLTA